MTDAELLDHLLRLEAYDEGWVNECELCVELQRRLDALKVPPTVHEQTLQD